ncbi:hypothetical protein ACFVT5_08870 [Streptomyces sp. NPDC058001]
MDRASRQHFCPTPGSAFLGVDVEPVTVVRPGSGRRDRVTRKRDGEMP